MLCSFYRVFIIVKLYFAYAIFASFLLQFYVPMDFLEPAFFDLVKLDRLTYRFPRHYKKLQSLVKLTFRSALVLLTGEEVITKSTQNVV